MKRFFCLVLLMLCNTTSSTNYSNIERKTIDAAFDALQKFQILYIASKMCQNYEYVELAPRGELESLVADKLKVNVEKLELMAEESEHYIQALTYQLKDIECANIDVDDYLSTLYDDYDIAKFNLELYQPISSPVMTQRELAYQNQDALKEYLTTNAKEANSIIVANLIPRSEASQAYLYNTRNIIEPSEYVYEIIEGWKTPMQNQYLTPSFSTQSSLKNGEYKTLIKKKGKIKEILFIKKELTVNIVLGSVNLEYFPADLSFLDTAEWHWFEHELILDKHK